MQFYYLMPFVLQHQFLITGTCECYFICKKKKNKNKTLQMQLRILRWKKLSWIIQVDPKYNHKCPYKREI